MSTDYIIRRRPESVWNETVYPHSISRYIYEAETDTVTAMRADGESFSNALWLRRDLQDIVRLEPNKWEVVYDGDAKVGKPDRRVTLHVTEVIMLDGEVISRDDALTLYNELREVLRGT